MHFEVITADCEDMDLHLLDNFFHRKIIHSYLPFLGAPGDKSVIEAEQHADEKSDLGQKIRSD